MDIEPVAIFIRWKSSYSNISPFAMTGIESAATTSAISSHFAGSLGRSATFLNLFKPPKEIITQPSREKINKNKEKEAS